MLVLIGITLTLYTGIKGYSYKKSKLKPNIEVRFMIDDEEVIDISDSFSIEFIINKNSYFGKVMGNCLTLPRFPFNDKKADIVFKYNDYTLNFQNVKMDLILFEGRIRWVFIIKNPPFSDSSVSQRNGKNPSRILYLRFSPEEASGIEIIQPDYN